MLLHDTIHGPFCSLFRWILTLFFFACNAVPSNLLIRSQTGGTEQKCIQFLSDLKFFVFMSLACIASEVCVYVFPFLYCVLGVFLVPRVPSCLRIAYALFANVDFTI